MNLNFADFENLGLAFEGGFLLAFDLSLGMGLLAYMVGSDRSSITVPSPDVRLRHDIFFF